MVSMKKILLAHTLKELVPGENTVLAREDLKIFTAATTDDIISLHKTERVDIIIADIEMPGRPLDDLCSLIRREDDLKSASIILACPRDSATIKRCRDCGANAVFPKPIDRKKLFLKITQFLKIEERESIREIVKISVNVNHKSESFFTISGNISASGMLMETDRVLSKGDLITCSFVLQYPVTARGKIARAETKSKDMHLYGVKFLDIDEDTRAQIEEFIKKRHNAFP